MPLELTPGITVPIPCRPCGKAFVSFTIEAGTRPLKCPRCGEATIVTVSLDKDRRWRIRTEAQRAPAATANRR